MSLMKKIGDKTKPVLEKLEVIGGMSVAIAPFVVAGGIMLEALTAPFRMAVAIPANLAIAGVEAVVETIERKSPHQYRGRVKEIGYSRLVQTKGVLYWVNMELPNGEIMRVYDKPRVTEGKFLANSVIPSRNDLADRLAWYQKFGTSIDELFLGGSKNPIEIGREYNFSAIGSSILGCTILSSEKI